MVEKEQNLVQLNDQLRINALEKEIVRLRTLTHKQSAKYNRLKKVSFFQVLFFIFLFIMLSMYGFLQWPESHKKITTNNAVKVLPTAEYVLLDTTNIILAYEDSLTEKLPIEISLNPVVYSVQIGAYSGIDMAPFELNLVSLQQYTVDDINQFTAGIFNDYGDATQFRALLVKMGFTDAFVIATYQGKRISINEALALQNDKSLPENPSPQTSVPNNYNEGVLFP